MCGEATLSVQPTKIATRWTQDRQFVVSIIFKNYCAPLESYSSVPTTSCENMTACEFTVHRTKSAQSPSTDFQGASVQGPSGRCGHQVGSTQRVCLCPMAVVANNWAAPSNSCLRSRRLDARFVTCIFCSKLIQSKLVGKGGNIFKLTSKHSWMLAATPNIFPYLAANEHGH